MASAAPAQQQLPILYNDLRPLSSLEHGGFRMQKRDTAPFLSQVHAVPLTIDEFIMAQRCLPIVFSADEKPVPLALMGLNEGVNVFIGDDGSLTEQNIYMPAYIRRYPFMLAKLQQENDEMSLCFDPTSDIIGDYDEGEMLFDGGQPTDVTKGLLEFCEHFETAGRRTQAFVETIIEADLMMDGEVSIQPEGQDKPYLYRGFKMVNEEKLKEIRGDKARDLIKNGALPLIYAHMMSLSLLRDVFARQVAQGKLPAQPDAPAPSPVVAN
ncbi:MAG: SapC family protein [Sphingomonadaceae bacterium]|nr:SapC family protein [Sphingomonadaceae bacterium]